MLVAMVAGTALVMVLGRRSETTHRPQAPKPPPPEQPWLSADATAQIVSADGLPGPLFVVAIDLEIRDGGLTAIRFAVTYGGCCGYEAADKLGLRLGRTSTGVCCVCGPDRSRPSSLGFQVATLRGKVAQVQIALPGLPDGSDDELKVALRAQWGRPTVSEDTWTWKKADRRITAELDGYPTIITIHAK